MSESRGKIAERGAGDPRDCYCEAHWCLRQRRSCLLPECKEGLLGVLQNTADGNLVRVFPPLPCWLDVGKIVTPANGNCRQAPAVCSHCNLRSPALPRKLCVTCIGYERARSYNLGRSCSVCHHPITNRTKGDRCKACLHPVAKALELG